MFCLIISYNDINNNYMYHWNVMVMNGNSFMIQYLPKWNSFYILDSCLCLLNAKENCGSQIQTEVSARSSSISLNRIYLTMIY